MLYRWDQIVSCITCKNETEFASNEGEAQLIGSTLFPKPCPEEKQDFVTSDEATEAH